MTRNKIEYELHKTPYKTTVAISNNKYLILYFSSHLYLDNFICKYIDNNFNYFNKKIFYGVNLEVVEIILLYREIEKRGFLISTEQQTYDKIEQIPFTIGEWKNEL